MLSYGDYRAFDDKLDRILAGLETIQTQHRAVIAAMSTLNAGVQVMSAELDTLTTEVAESKTVMESAAVLLSGLSAQIVALKDDPVKLAALAAELDANSNALAAAVAANTPAEPTT